MKPSIEVLEVELEQMIAESVGISSDSAEVGSDGYYKDSREIDMFFDED
jgi:hypothetical protein